MTRRHKYGPSTNVEYICIYTSTAWGEGALYIMLLPTYAFRSGQRSVFAYKFTRSAEVGCRVLPTLPASATDSTRYTVGRKGRRRAGSIVKQPDTRIYKDYARKENEMNTALPHTRVFQATDPFLPARARELTYSRISTADKRTSRKGEGAGGGRGVPGV